MIRKTSEIIMFLVDMMRIMFGQNVKILSSDGKYLVVAEIRHITLKDLKILSLVADQIRADLIYEYAMDQHKIKIGRKK